MDDLSHIFDELESVEIDRNTILKMPFAWPGSKQRCLPAILPELPYKDNFIEVFGGSGAVIFNRRPCKLDVFNDAYSGVVDFYKCVRDKYLFPKLCDYLVYIRDSRQEFLESKLWKDINDPVERAAKWYTMIVLSFGYLGRNYNRSGTPKTLTNKIDSFHQIHQRVQDIRLENLDWSVCQKDYAKGKSVLYYDPPYIGTDPGIYECKFTMSDLKTLCENCFELPGYHVISHYHHDLFNQFNWTQVIKFDHLMLMTPKVFNEQNGLTGKEAFLSENRTVEEVLFIKDNL